jgi:hypothetical protein
VVHASPSSQLVPAATAAHTPSLGAPCATLHASQSATPPPQGVSQHTPSTQ